MSSIDLGISDKVIINNSILHKGKVYECVSDVFTLGCLEVIELKGLETPIPVDFLSLASFECDVCNSSWDYRFLYFEGFIEDDDEQNFPVQICGNCHYEAAPAQGVCSEIDLAEEKALALPVVVWRFCAYKSEKDYANGEYFFTQDFLDHAKMKTFSGEHSVIGKRIFNGYCSMYWKIKTSNIKKS